jgi:hypothetical protein
VSSTRDTAPPDSTARAQDDELARARREIDELKVLLGRATVRIMKLEKELEASRAQEEGADRLD